MEDKAVKQKATLQDRQIKIYRAAFKPLAALYGVELNDYYKEQVSCNFPLIQHKQPVTVEDRQGKEHIHTVREIITPQGLICRAELYTFTWARFDYSKHVDDTSIAHELALNIKLPPTPHINAQADIHTVANTLYIFAHAIDSDDYSVSVNVDESGVHGDFKMWKDLKHTTETVNGKKPRLTDKVRSQQIADYIQGRITQAKNELDTLLYAVDKLTPTSEQANVYSDVYLD